MPYAVNNGQRIHYTVEGSGPLVVLQHGLFMDGENWRANGTVAALCDSFRVACIDSLGHGLSDKPADPAFYDQSRRAGDIVAVLDDLGEDRAHLVGYSMGAWLGVGVAKYHPDRLASLSLGGWDVTGGMPNSAMGPVTFDMFLAFARGMAPTLVGWVTPAYEPGLRACFDALRQLDGADPAVTMLRVPVLLWAGRDDVYHAPMQAFATARGLPFVSTGGDHLAADRDPGGGVFAALRGVLENA